MALQPCPECKGQVSDQAESCPHCGFVLRKQQVLQKKNNTKLISGIFLTLLFLFSCALCVGKLGKTPTSTTDSSPGGQPVPNDEAGSSTDQNYSLELVSWNWRNTAGGSYVEASGEVKNISTKPLHSVDAVVSFYTADGTFITSSDALIDFNPILPGQTSPFSVLQTRNPEMSKASVQFKFLLGGTINTKPER